MKLPQEKDSKEFLAQSKFYEGYSRYIPEENRYEEWPDSIRRVMDMHKNFYKDKMTDELRNDMDFVEKLYLDKRILGAQRALQFGGEQLIRHQARLYNCAASVVDRPEFFGETMYLLLCGAGVGFAVYKKYTSKLPRVVPRTKQPKLHSIEDSIEGWATALDILLSSFFENGGKHPEYAGRKVYFEFTKIRPKGSPISGGFKAPGPEPLRAALNKVENTLITAAEQKRNLKPIEIYDIVMYASDAVLSGGIRRSAAICIFDADDNDMMTAKTGNWRGENPQRGRSNNSAGIIRSQTTREEFSKIYSNIKQFGEPGFIFVDDDEIVYNPCVEIGMYPFLENEDGTKASGFQGCNLVEINGSKCDSKELFLESCKAAAIIGTLQAGYTDFKFLTDTTKKIFEKESLIGVSVTGWMNSPSVLFNEETLKEGGELIKATNKRIAKIIGINPAARTTCCKPSGNACLTFDTHIKTENGSMTLEEIFEHCTDKNINISNDTIGNDTVFQMINGLKVYDENNDLQDITGLYVNGMSQIYEIEFEDGKTYKFSDNHKLKTQNGWKTVSDLNENDIIESF